MDGTFDKWLEPLSESEYEELIAEVPEDLREVQKFEDFVKDLLEEMQSWK